MCLSVPLFAIQTFPLFLSFGIFLNFSPCRVLGSEGLAAPRGSGGSAGGQEDRRAGAGALSPPGWVWLCWAPGKVSRVSRSPVKRLGQAGGVSSKHSPHSLQDLAEAAPPLPKTPPKPPERGRNSRELEQLRTKPGVSSRALHLWAFFGGDGASSGAP